MIVFLVVGAVGLAPLALSFVVGELADGVFEGLGAGEMFSTSAIGGFLAAFGFGGALGLSLGVPAGLGVVIGLAAGAAVAFAVGRFTRSLGDDHTDVTPTAAHLVGLRGTVVTDIPDAGFGQISVVVAGHPDKLNARAPEPLPMGTAVHVVSVLSPTSVLVGRLE
jgi:membrane protein implicated in regulation of membrane protease activity